MPDEAHDIPDQITGQILGHDVGQAVDRNPDLEMLTKRVTA